MPHTVNLSLLQKLFVLGTGIIALSLGFAGCTTTTSQSPRVVRHHPAQPRAQSGQPGLLADAMASVVDEHNNSVAKGENGEGLNEQTVTGNAAKSSGNADNDAIAKLQSVSGKDGPIKTIGLNGIDIKDAVGVALARHPDIGRSNAVVAQGKAQIAIEKSAWYPTLQYSVNPGYNRYYSSSNNKNDPGNVRGTLGATQLIYDFGRTSSRIGAAQATNEKQIHQLSGTMEDVAQNMANTFIELSAAQDLISAAERETNLLRDTHDKISQRVKAGLSDASDLNQAEVAMERAKSDLLQATTRFDVAAGKFAQISGFRPTKVATLAETARFMDSLSKGKDDIDKTPAVLAAEAEVRASQQRVRLAKADRFPSVSLGVSQSGATGQRNATNDSTFVGLQLSGQFSTGKREKYQIEAAEAELNNAKQLMNLSLSSRDLYWQQYTLNKRPLTDVLNAERDTFSAESDQITAISDRLYAKVKAYYAVGQLVTRLRERS